MDNYTRGPGLSRHDPSLQGYLCPLSANTYGIEFLKFEIKDYDTNRVVYQVCLHEAGQSLSAHVHDLATAQVAREPDPEPLPDTLDPGKGCVLKVLEMLCHADAESLAQRWRT